MDQVRSEQFATNSDILDIAPVRLTAILQHCAKIAQALAAARNIHLHVDLPPDLSVLTDELKVRSIVTNLLSNAVEYTPIGGRVSLTLEILPLPPGMKPPFGEEGDTLPPGVASAKLLRFTVADTGPGIAPEHLPHLFEPFYRADKTRGVNPQHHLGLGLFLVRAHTQRLGGQSRVDSIVNEGATFTIDLPAAVIGETPEPSEPPVKRQPSLQGILG
jgi:two-component system phosphate regulon sensor histidine kinase PhoR